MRLKPALHILNTLLFRISIDYVNDDEKEDFIASKNVNDPNELREVFDLYLKPEYVCTSEEAREWYLMTLRHYLDTDESFDSVFDKLTLLFDDEVEDRRQFMQILYECLTRYNEEMK